MNFEESAGAVVNKVAASHSSNNVVQQEMFSSSLNCWM